MVGMIGALDESRAARPGPKPKLATVTARPRSVTFRPTGDEIKNVVITNSMLSQDRPQVAASEKVNKYGVNVINERALGRVGDLSVCSFVKQSL